MLDQKLVGITVFPEYFQSEGIDAVLDRVINLAGVNAVTTSPYVMAESVEGSGEREPPDDAGQGMARLLDRPLWGKRELWVETAPSFTPDVALYQGLRYQPPPATDLTITDGPKVGEFLRAAKARGLKVYLQIQAAYPPGYRAQFGEPDEADAPRLPDGRLCPGRVDRNGSLASPEIRGYGEALVRDVVAHYPEIDGLRVDWPEYPPYTFDSLFFDFSAHAMEAAERLGFDTDRMRRDASRLYNRLHGGITDDALRSRFPAGRKGLPIPDMLLEYGGVYDLLQLKKALVKELLTGFRSAIDSGGGRDIALVPNAFPPPWSLATGMDLSQLDGVVDAVSVKLYTMHWPMMVSAYGKHLFRANPSIDATQLMDAVVRALNIADDDSDLSPHDYAYPEPDVPHPVGADAQYEKIERAQEQADPLPVYALAHGYGPVDDFETRFIIALDASSYGVWVNRYGYLSDDKLRAMGEALGGPITRDRAG